MSTSLRPRAADRASGDRTPPAQALLVGVILAVGAFEVLWFGVVTHGGLALVDPQVVEWVAAHREPWLVTAAVVVTDVGSPAVMITVAVLALGWWAWRRDRARAVLGFAGLGAVLVVDVGAKTLVARPRPPLVFQAVAAQGYSFPSGHAVVSAGVVLLLLWLVRPVLAAVARRVRTSVVVVAVLVVAAVGCSRVVLGVHYPSDVLAGWALALLVVSAVGLLEVALGRGDA
ncbi:phosphatase PAP2 family protein [Actinomycetospora sp. NBRC 106378]|uniref:phosphatase PAP2 family protein n=1 Tax=Actinomycetospora sp. NBRC 106378 TaxID=3032208 RepID=UPI002556F3F7|nr:phosphatase PAP2 family protein [Actinomycetospora sp. NBRC 106378]